MAVFVLAFVFVLSTVSSWVSSSHGASPHFWNSSSDEISPLSATIGRLGFEHFAMASQYMSPALVGPVTVFAPPDSHVRSCFSYSLDLLLREHTIPGLFPLNSLLSAGELESVLPGRCLTIASSAHATTFFIGASQITHPNLFVSDHVIVHGLRGFISPHSCFSSFFIPRIALSTRFTSPLHDTVLVVTRDGILSLVEMKSHKILWSIHTGHQIYSSYQAPEILDDTYIDCGDDWVLYRFDRSRGAIERLKSARDLIRETNQLLRNGITVIGQMGTTVFVVQAKTGIVTRVFKFGSSVDKRESLIVIGDEGIEEIFITRIDYAFVAYSKVSGDLLWNLSVAEFESETNEQPVCRIQNQVYTELEYG